MPANTPETLNVSNTPGFQIYVNSDSDIRTTISPRVAAAYIRSFFRIKTDTYPLTTQQFPDKSSQEP